MDRGNWGGGLVPAVKFWSEGGEDGMVGSIPLLSSQSENHTCRPTRPHLEPSSTYPPCSLRLPEAINHTVCVKPATQFHPFPSKAIPQVYTPFFLKCT